MLARLTWTPDNNTPETLTVDLPAELYDWMRALIGTPEWARSDATQQINVVNGGGGRRLFRLARITAIEPEQQ